MDHSEAEAVDLVFRALADPVRRRIVEILRRPPASCCDTDGSVCGCDLEAPLDLSQATVSHHMKCLALAGLVSGEKRGRWVHWKLRPERFRLAGAWLAAFDAAPARANPPPRRRAA
ncbi:MAG: helix-turn-helix transcriptional regulator [Rhodospirillales bacterium]|nr:MAG: helix-turn-helix transcriptional regulator [Rhodospirillales bacterium]